MVMIGSPVPSGHAVQARVAPLPDARGWASSHTTQHIVHESDLLMTGTCRLQLPARPQPRFVSVRCTQICMCHMSVKWALIYMLYHQSARAHQHNT